jgi:hypothetical protein
MQKSMGAGREGREATHLPLQLWIKKRKYTKHWHQELKLFPNVTPSCFNIQTHSSQMSHTNIPNIVNVHICKQIFPLPLEKILATPMQTSV